MRQVIGRDSPVYFRDGSNHSAACSAASWASRSVGTHRRAAVPVQAVLTQLDGEDRPRAVFAKGGGPCDPGHRAPSCDRITFDFSMSSIAPLHVARDKTCARAGWKPSSGPVAVRIKADPVAPDLGASVAGRAMMRRRSSSGNSSVAPAAGRWVGRAQRVSRRRGVGGGEAQWAQARWVPRPPPWSRCCRVPRSACSPAWRRCRRWPCGRRVRCRTGCEPVNCGQDRRDGN